MAGKAPGEAEAMKLDGALDADEETEKQRKERESKQKRQRLKEFGGPVSTCKLLSLASPWEKFVFFFGLVMAMMHGAAQPLMCLMFGDLIDALAVSVSVGGQFDFLSEVSGVAVQFMLIGVGVCVVGTGQGFAFPYFAESQVSKMRPLYFEVALHRDVGWFDTHDASALPTEMGQELDTYAEAFGNKLGTSVMSLMAAILGYAFGLYLCWQVGLMMTLALPVMGLGGALMGQAVMDMMQEVQGAYTNAAILVNEVLYAVRTVVSFGGERRELTRYTEQIEVARRGGIKTQAKMGFGLGYIWAAYFSAMALAFYFGMILVYDGLDLSVGRMMAAFFCVLTAGFTIGQIPPGFTSVYETRSTMARFFYLNDHESEIQKRTDKRETIGPIESLQLDNVHFAYPARPATPVLNGISLSVLKGQKVAVVGESGSGKSTVMALLERFYDPQQGQVLVNGRDLKQFSVKSFRSQVGYVGQEPVLFATSVRANIMQGSPNAIETEIQRVARHAQLDFINDLPDRFDTFVGSGGSQFSGGQKQRIAIARALLKQPSVLFLDEATSALDSASEKMIQGTIDKIGSDSELGITIVSIAHRLSTVRNSDVIYVLSGGCVVEQGSHNELTAREGGVYKALAAAQELAGQGGNNNEGESSGMAEQEDQEKQATGPKRRSKQMSNPVNNPTAEEERQKQIAKTYKVPMLRLATLCKPEWIYFIPGVLAALGSGASFPVLATFFLVDAMVAFLGQSDKERMRNEVENAALWFVIVGVWKWVCTIIQFLCFAIMGEAMTKRARIEMLTSIFKQEVGFHDNPENTPGMLSKALQVHAYRIARFCLSLGDAADAICSVLVGLSLAFVNSWEMTLAMLLTIPIFGAAQSIQILVMMGSAKKENATLKTAQQVLTDAIINSRTVQAANSEQDLLGLYSSIIQPTEAHLCRRHVLAGFAFGLSNGIMFWMISAGFWFMGFLIDEGRTDFEKGQRAFMGVLYAAMGAGMALAFTGDASKAKVSAHDMFELIDRKPLIDGLNPVGVEPTDNTQVGRVEFTNVCFHYPFRPDVQVLNGVTFTIEAGQSVGICGPSGGGKSTVMSLIQRFYDPQQGSILLGQDRLPLNSVNIRWWRKQIGFVGQEPVLFDATVLENVRYGLGDGEAISKERLEEYKQMANLGFLDEGISQGWETKVGPRGARLSGGQKQRVAICRALVRNPPILLLDEATSALDSQSEQKVSAALEAARQGRTSFAIAHRLSTIQDCDVILVVAEGTIVERGSHSELVEAKGVYYKLQGQSLSAK